MAFEIQDKNNEKTNTLERHTQIRKQNQAI